MDLRLFSLADLMFNVCMSIFKLFIAERRRKGKKCLKASKLDNTREHTTKKAIQIYLNYLGFFSLQKFIRSGSVPSSSYKLSEY